MVGEPAPIVRRRSTSSGALIALLGALTALPPLSIDVSLPGLPLVASALHASRSAVQGSLSIFIFAFGAGQLAIGPSSDRYGRRPVLLCGLALFTLASVACTVAPNVSTLLVARFVQGVGACAGTVIARAIVQDISRERDRAATLQAYVTALNALAPMIAPLLGIAILAVTGWRWLYGVLIVIGLALFAAVALRLRETSPGRSGDTIAAYRRVLALPRTIPLALFTACAFGAYFALISGSPFVLVTQMHLPRELFALAFALNALAGLCGSVVVGRVVTRVGSENAFAAGAIMFAGAGSAAWCADAFAPEPVRFVATFAAVAAAFGFAAPCAFAAALADAGVDAGLTAGVLGAAQMLGGAAATTAAGALPLAPAAAFGTVAAVSAGVAAAAYGWSRVRSAHTVATHVA